MVLKCVVCVSGVVTIDRLIIYQLMSQQTPDMVIEVVTNDLRFPQDSQHSAV